MRILLFITGLWLATAAAAHGPAVSFVENRGQWPERVLYGAVADFFSFHAFGFQWYVFNIADSAIVAGVVGLLYDSLFRGHKKVGNPSKL